MNTSDLSDVVHSLTSLPQQTRRQILAGTSGVSGRAADMALHLWPLWARDSQIAPAGDWSVWLVMAGRGFGKTRTGAEWVRSRVESGASGRIALVARTPADVRDVMIEGDSGLLNVCPPWNRPKYEPTKRRLTWPNGAFALAFSSHEPDQLRGPQFDAAWCDELASWEYPRETWDNLVFGLRLGAGPQCVVTTTPRPIELLRELVARDDVRVTTGSTYENSEFLAPAFSGRSSAGMKAQTPVVRRSSLSFWMRRRAHSGVVSGSDTLRRLPTCCASPLRSILRCRRGPAAPRPELSLLASTINYADMCLQTVPADCLRTVGRAAPSSCSTDTARTGSSANATTAATS